MGKNKLDFNDPDAEPGIICKSASVQPLEVSAEDMKKINKYTLSPLNPEDVFVFKAMIADNEQDDRNFMPFNLKALQDLKKLYPGKTMLKDHNRRADNQIARIFDTELKQDGGRKTALGELHTELTAKVYMLNNESNKDLIASIKGGIKKEVSTSCSPDKMVCSICGCDNMKDYCSHWPGRSYTVSEGGKSVCSMLLDGAKEAYELSFVAVPAQPRAGAVKSTGFSKPVGENEDNPTEDIKNKSDTVSEVDLKIQIADTFTKIERNGEMKYE